MRTYLAAVFLLLAGALGTVANAAVETRESSEGIELDTDGGFSLESKDGRYGFRIGGRLHYDHESWEGSFSRAQSGSSREEYDVRRMRLQISGHANAWKFMLDYDFESASGQATNPGSGVRDAYAQYVGAGDWAIVTIGRFKAPFTMDNLTSSNDVLSLERNVLVQAFAPPRVDGVSIGGHSKYFTYKVHAWTEDEQHGQEADSSYGVRLTWAPLYDRDNYVVHVGFSGMERDVSQATPAGLSAATESRRATYLSTGLLAYDGITVTGAEFGFASPGILFQAEYVDAEYENWAANDIGPIDMGGNFDGYTAQISWVITGETHYYDQAEGVFGGINPLTGAGAWEVFARYSSLDLRTGNAPSAGVTSEEDRYSAATYGVSWYGNRNLRVTLNYITTEIERYTLTSGAAATLDEQLIDGDSLGIRLQYVF
jgi:phosphate-selective porin OprO/OprP